MSGVNGIIETEVQKGEMTKSKRREKVETAEKEGDGHVKRDGDKDE